MHITLSVRLELSKEDKQLKRDKSVQRVDFLEVYESLQSEPMFCKGAKTSVFDFLNFLRKVLPRDLKSRLVP